MRTISLIFVCLVVMAAPGCDTAETRFSATPFELSLLADESERVCSAIHMYSDVRVNMLRAGDQIHARIHCTPHIKIDMVVGQGELTRVTPVDYPIPSITIPIDPDAFNDQPPTDNHGERN